MYLTQLDDRSCFFRYDQGLKSWQPYDALLGASPMPTTMFKSLEPSCLVLPHATSRSVPCPQNIVSFSMSLDFQSTSTPLSSMLKLEATQSGVAVPIRAMLLSTSNMQPGVLRPQEFDISAGVSFSPLTESGVVDPRGLLRLEFQLDLSRALPGLLVFNLWSSTDKPLVPMLLATGSALLLHKGLERVSEDLIRTKYALGEDLLPDLAEILAINDPYTKSSRMMNSSDTVLHKRQLLIVAKDILEWSREAGLHHLERLASDQVDFMELPELMPIPMSALWAGWWTGHGLILSVAWNIYRGTEG